MRKQRIWVVLLAWLTTGSALVFSQQQGTHYYNVDQEVTISGKVQEVIMEPRNPGSAPFLNVILKENTTGTMYKIEISPAWFFEHDLHQGESLKITGSQVESGEAKLIMARRVQFRGEMSTVRDKHGFPNWSRNRGNSKGRRKR
jgi:hypothetical protein